MTPPMILRPGAITKEMLSEVIGEVAVDETLISENSTKAPKAPGMKYRHYAPKAEMIIVDGEPEEAVRAIKQIVYEQVRLGYKVGIIASNESVDQYTTGVVKCIGSRVNEKTVARNLYKVLREFDEEEVDYIYSEAFPEAGIGTAIMNRLGKAAGHHVLQASEITKLQDCICEQQRELSCSDRSSNSEKAAAFPGIRGVCERTCGSLPGATESESRRTSGETSY